MGLNIAENVAMQGIPVAVFSLEMTQEALVKRALSGLSGVDSTLIRSKKFLTPHDYEKIQQAADDLSRYTMVLSDLQDLTPMQLRAKAKRFRQMYDIELIVVDYLQLMQAPKKENRFVEVGYISSSLKLLARELNIPVLVMSQLNRMAEMRTDHRPRLSDLRESGNIEQDADVVILLHREDYYHKNDSDYENTNKAEVIIDKQRNGPQGTIELQWDGPHTSFKNMNRDNYEQ